MVFSIGYILSQWESAGVFDFLLPFLLIFAVVFGILITTNVLGNNKGVHVIIAIVVGLLALRLDFVPKFFAEVFPRLGVGLAVILTLLILIGLFVPDDERRYWLWGLGAIAVIVGIVVISKAFGQTTWFGASGSYSDYVGWIIGAVLIVGLIIAVAAAGNEKKDKESKIANLGPWRS